MKNQYKHSFCRTEKKRKKIQEQFYTQQILKPKINEECLRKNKFQYSLRHNRKQEI